MQLTSISLVSLIAVLVGVIPVQAQSLSEQERAELCAKSPGDTRCMGDQSLIALRDRPGESGACVVITNMTEQRTECRLVVSEQQLIAYYEVGEKLDTLDNRKATREIRIRPSDIKALRFQEGTKDITTARVVNTLLFGIGGLFGTRDKRVAEITVDYIAPTQTVSTPAMSPQPTPLPDATTIAPPLEAGIHRVKVVVRRRTGEDLRAKIEQLTGLKAEVPVEQKRSAPEASPTEGN